MKTYRKHISLYCLFTLFLVCNFVFWTHSRGIKASWANVPPPQSYAQALVGGLGDAQLSYRLISHMLLNLGSVGGDIKHLSEYNYENLAQWFFVSLELDDRSEFIPYLAAYYYGAVQEPDQVSHILPYLYDVGTLPYEAKWRYLAHAIYLARHVANDFETALEYADALSLLPGDLPLWTKQMRAFVRYDQGQKEAAYDILKQILISGTDTLPPQEIYVMREYICEKILDEEQARSDILCQQ